LTLRDLCCVQFEKAQEARVGVTRANFNPHCQGANSKPIWFCQILGRQWSPS
jgi:hypothetical protein